MFAVSTNAGDGKTHTMTSTFDKTVYTDASTTQEVAMINALGFNVEKADVSIANGKSVYAYVNVNVVNEGKMPYEVFVYEGKARLCVRISDHASNLERICGGSSRDKVSFLLFSRLVKNGVITQ
jgi:hypothetical protein